MSPQHPQIIGINLQNLIWNKLINEYLQQTLALWFHYSPHVGFPSYLFGDRESTFSLQTKRVTLYIQSHTSIVTYTEGCRLHWKCWLSHRQGFTPASGHGSVVKNLPAVQETQVWSLGQEDPLEEGMATHSSILTRKTPWTKEPGRLQSIGSPRVGHNWSDLASMHILQYDYHDRVGQHIHRIT